MPSQIGSLQTQKMNTCPHGLPPGACPICNGMGGGTKPKQAEQTKKTDEWSWMKCYMMGQMMRGKEAREAANEAIAQRQITFAKEVAQNINSFVVNAQSVLQKIQNSLPPQLQSIFAKIANSIISPVLNLLSKIPMVLEKIEQFVNQVRTQILAVAEKLTALLSEIKGFIEEKLYKNFKKLAKKLLKLFIWADDGEEQGEIDEEMEIFKSKELKKLKKAILRIKNKDEGR